MSKRNRRRESGGGWQNAGNSMTLEEAGRLGYGLHIDEPDSPADDTPENAIVPTEEGTFIYKRFQLSRVGITIPDDVEPDEWLDVFQVLRKLDEAIQWAVGDLVNHAEAKWGETYKHIAEVTGYSEKSLREYAYVARSVQMSIRMDNLSFGHHQLVAGLKDAESNIPLIDEQQAWLTKADENGWSIKKMREAMKAARQNATDEPDDDWLFGRKRVPQIDTHMQRLWSKARNGDDRARHELLGMVSSMRQWLDDVVDSLEE